MAANHIRGRFSVRRFEIFRNLNAHSLALTEVPVSWVASDTVLMAADVEEAEAGRRDVAEAGRGRLERVDGFTLIDCGLYLHHSFRTE